MDMSDDSAAAYTALADVLNRVAPEQRDELVSAINALIEARIGDAIWQVADRVEEALLGRA